MYIVVCIAECNFASKSATNFPVSRRAWSSPFKFCETKKVGIFCWHTIHSYTSKILQQWSAKKKQCNNPHDDDVQKNTQILLSSPFR